MLNEEGRNRRAELATMLVCHVAASLLCLALTFFGATGSAGPLWIFVGGFGIGLIISAMRFVLWRANHPVR